MTESGNVFAKSATDWKWWNPCVPDTLRELHRDGYDYYAPPTLVKPSLGDGGGY